jgi:hypothetical protein
MLISKNHWGTFIWSYLHTISIFCDKEVPKVEFYRIKNLLKNIKYIIPCQTCKEEYSKYIPTLNAIKYSLFLKDKMILFKWGFIVHNKVNQKLNKKIFKYEEAIKKWTKKS